MSKYTESDAAKDTQASMKDVQQAWHDARDAAAQEGGHGVPADRHGSIVEAVKSFFGGGKSNSADGWGA